MASEIEQPFRLSFQSDSIHSGSISFGRFETEALSWERRSSFSHNRYLEEVEKYSRPGSVTEKKAYFEAHFKRRALLSQCPSDCQTGIEYQTSENDLSENTGYSEELEQTSEGSNHSVLFDKSLNGSECGGEIEVTNHERPDMGTSYVETLFKLATDTCSRNVCSAAENVTEVQSSNIIDEEPRKEINDNHKHEAASVDSTHKSVDSFTNSCTITGGVSVSAIEDDTVSSEPQQESSPQVQIKLRSKPTAPKSKSVVMVSQSRQTSSGRVLSNNGAEKHDKTGREISRTTTNTKLLSQKAASVPNSLHRILKPEDSKTSKLKLVQDKRSVKELKTEKAVRPKASAVHKVVPEARQTANRMLNEKSTKHGTRNSSNLSHCQSGERPERIKEEKKKAELNQHRKCPNLMATPKSSFSREAVQRSSGKNKVVSSSDDTSRLRSKSAPGFPTTVKPSSDVKAKSCQTTYNAKPATTGSSRRQASPAGNCSQTSAHHGNGVSVRPPMTDGGHPKQVEVCGVVKCRKENAKESGVSVQKHQLTGSNQIRKAPRKEQNHKMDVTSRAETLRKDIKGRCIVAGVLGTARSAVGVAS